MLNICKIDLFKNSTCIEEIKEGYKKRKKYKIITPTQEYFIKVHNYKMSDEEIKKEKWLYNEYEKLGIPIVPLLDIIIKDNNTIFVYPFFNGNTLTKSDLTLKEFMNYGIKVGKDVIKINNITYDSNLFKPFQLELYFKKDLENCKKIWKNTAYRKKLLQIFTENEIKLLLDCYNNLFEKVKNEKVMLNHNDIKTENILLDNENNYFFIDIDPFDLTIPGFNIYYSIFCFLFLNFQENEKYFLKGFIQTIDSKRKLIGQLHYFLIADFINELEELLNNNFDLIQENHKLLKQMLFNENNIITKVIYEKQ